jgi:hypothetical protein
MNPFVTANGKPVAAQLPPRSVFACARLNPKFAEHPARREECGRCATVRAFPSRDRKSYNFTSVRFRSQVNIDDFRCLAMVKWVEVEQALVKRAFSQTA